HWTQNVDPKKRLVISISLLVMSCTGLYIDSLGDDNPFKRTFDRKDVTYRTIDYRKPAGQRVTVVRNGVIIEGGPDNIKAVSPSEQTTFNAEQQQDNQTQA
ncbi:hypothetical protein SAMD00019534_088360, partial [Acytostelium subglobosum LB1]|uniref:hypothetical protein n=1 Tax=Acytostelium subglobosum LB1 TaxID=1410327 RepID=UPI0006448589